VQGFRKENDAALESYNAALTLFRQVGSKLGEANVLLELCLMELRRGNFDKAKAAFENTVALHRLIGDLFSEGRDYYYYARTLIELEQKKDARPYALQAKICFKRVGEKYLVEYAERLIAACDE